MNFLALTFFLAIILGASLADNPPYEVTKLSILNNKLAEDKSLPILSVTTLSTVEQRETKGNDDEIIRQVFALVEKYEFPSNQDHRLPVKQEFRVLPLVPAVEASESGPVFVVNNPFYSRNHTLNNINAPKCLPLCKIRYIPFQHHNLTTNGLKKLSEILSTLAKRYGEGLQQKVQLVPLVLSRRIESSLMEWTTYKLNVGVAVVAPEEDGYRALTALVLKLKSKRVWLGPDYNGEDYWNYDENVHNAVESAE